MGEKILSQFSRRPVTEEHHDQEPKRNGGTHKIAVDPIDHGVRHFANFLEKGEPQDLDDMFSRMGKMGTEGRELMNKLINDPEVLVEAGVDPEKVKQRKGRVYFF